MSTPAPEIYVVGLGGHAHVVAGLALTLGYTIAGFLDSMGEPTGSEPILGRPVLGNIRVLQNVPAPQVVVGIGPNRVRANMIETLRAINPRCRFPSLVHPTARLEPAVTLGDFVTICVGATLCVEARIGAGTLINTAASVDHEGQIGRFCHIGPGARLAGRVTVGDFAHVGIGATVIEKVRIGRGAIIGAGAAVIRDVPDYSVCVGVPARVIKTLEPFTDTRSGCP